MKSRSFAIFSWILTTLGFITIQSLYAAGWRINTTSSEPLGIWKIVTRPSKIARGQIVSICPEDSAVFQLARSRNYIPGGNCSGNYEPLFKKVAALPGDTVIVSPVGIRINGTLLPNSKSLSQDSAQKPMPFLSQGKYYVMPGNIWLISSFNPKSFDSRYFGPLPVHLVQGIAQPIWVRNTL